MNDLLAYLLNNDGKNKPKWSWSPECQDTFSRVVKVLSSPPVLAYPDFELPFVLNVDASQEGLGATLCQNQGGKERVVAYGSRGLRIAERNYSAHKLEFLCLKWAVTEKFSEYLYGRPFTVRTDNNPLTYVTTSAKLDETGHRWLAALSTYDFDIIYRPGRKNLDADGLSRRLHHENDIEIVDREVITALCKSQQLPVVETICSEESCLEEACKNMEQPCLTKNDIKVAQEGDAVLSKFIMYKVKGTKPRKEEVAREGQEFRTLTMQWNLMILKNGILYRRRKRGMRKFTSW